MYALSSLALINQWKFTYYTNLIDPFFKKNPIGNLKLALDNGVTICELKSGDFEKTIEMLSSNGNPEKTIIVPMGAQTPLAESGIEKLAREIRQQIGEMKITNADIFLSSGTGTTAAFLAKHLPEYQVYTIPCVGNKEYLIEQIEQIFPTPENLVILNPVIKIKFAEPHPWLIEVYNELLLTGIEFDLIYDTQLWLWIQRNINKIQNRNIVFIHSGGVHGNPGQLARYRRKQLA